MDKILFSKPKQDSPSFCEIKGYISKEKANALLRDLIDFNNKVLLKDSIISDMETHFTHGFINEADRMIMNSNLSSLGFILIEKIENVEYWEQSI